MAYCRHCGSSIAEALSCSNCGKAVSENPQFLEELIKKQVKVQLAEKEKENLADEKQKKRWQEYAELTGVLAMFAAAIIAALLGVIFPDLDARATITIALGCILVIFLGVTARRKRKE